MNTFDVFDTLLARRFVDNENILKKIEHETKIVNFVKERKQADSGTRNIYDIYRALANKGLIDHSEVNNFVQLELDLEKDNAIPIKKNIDKVNTGDILISDMYLPAHAILHLVRSVGLKKEVTIYQSNGDKRIGAIWSAIQAHHNGTHYGDNQISDIDQANRMGINTYHCTEHEFNSAESFLIQNKLQSLGLLCREVRLRCEDNSNLAEYTRVAASLNLPMLFVMAELIHRKTERSMIFLGRDCQLLEKIFSEYYNQSIYLPFSRKVAYSQKDLAKKYLQQYNIENYQLFDISSTGATWEHLDNSHPIMVAIYSDTYHYTASKPNINENFSYLFTNSKIGSTNYLVELFNCGDHGHLSNIELLGEKVFKSTFDMPELPEETINAIHMPIHTAKSLSRYYRDEIRNELNEASEETLRSIFQTFVRKICDQQHLLKSDFLKREDEYLNKIRRSS